jgi:ABC-type lipoprotein release transport system permease subunit
MDFNTHTDLSKAKFLSPGWLFTLAWKNMWRNKSRTLISMAAVFFSVLLSILAASLKEGIFNNLIKNVVSFYSGYAQIHQRGYWDEQILDKSFEWTPQLAQKIASGSNIDSYAPRLESFALASGDQITKGCLVVGIDPDLENKITALRQKITAGNMIEKRDREVMLAEGLAKRLQMQVGDTLVLIGQGYHGSTAAGKYRIKSLLRFGSPELNQKALFLPLLLAQELYAAENRITSCVLSFKKAPLLESSIGSIRDQLGTEYEVMSWGEMMPDIKQHIETDTENMNYVQGILYLLIAFGIFGTWLMMMMERKRELGMLVAIGMQKRKLILLVIAESILTVIGGCILGMIAALPVVWYLQKHPLRLGGETGKAYEKFGFEAIFPTSSDPHIFWTQALTVLTIGIVLSLYPIYKIIRLNPVTAMK